ncbi:MAG: urease accessory protein UreF [Methylococcus sp.]|nr:MAG: urease accessory protein UreF [Methylococcus sp.]
MGTDRIGMLVRLFQLTSPSLPVGAYSYSQGLEWAVESDLVSDEESARRWLAETIEQVMGRLDAPVLSRMYDCWLAEDANGLCEWNRFLLASRETRELRNEDIQLAKALRKVLEGLEIQCPGEEQGEPSFALLFCLACVTWQIPKKEMISGYLWAWLENQVLAALKLVPLGQMAGQRILMEIGGQLPALIEEALKVRDPAVGASLPMLAIASSRHETQYSRLFRS